MNCSDHRRKRLRNTEVCRQDIESGPVLSQVGLPVPLTKRLCHWVARNGVKLGAESPSHSRAAISNACWVNSNCWVCRDSTLFYFV